MPSLNTLLKVLVILIISVLVIWIIGKVFAALLTVALIAGLIYLILVAAGFLSVPRWVRGLTRED